jgi:hypothetical protein
VEGDKGIGRAYSLVFEFQTFSRNVLFQTIMTVNR